MNSIYLRLMLPLGMTLIVAMFIAWAIALYLLTNAMDRRLDAQLGNATAILAEGTFPFSQDLVDRLDQLIEAHIVLLNASGAVGLSTGDAAINAALQDTAARVEGLPIDGVFVGTVTADGSPWRVTVRHLQPGRDERFFYVAAVAPLSETRLVARNSAVLLGGAMLLAAAVLALIGSFFTRSITRPVSDLAAMANRIGEGERDFPETANESNEIGVLAGTLTGMASRLQEYETELAKSSRLSGLGDLAARMAHEVRNPLTAIKMQLQLLEERVSEDDKERIGKVLDEFQRLELIVESTLVLGGPLNLQPVATDTRQLIEEVVDLLRPALQHRNISLAIDLPSLPMITVDAARIKQVLLNLINNAADELDQGGQIRISARVSAEQEHVDIAIEDSGPGADALLRSNPSSKPFGLGLGLTISREIVDGHGGEILISRSSELGGACFTIRLPSSIIAADLA